MQLAFVCSVTGEALSLTVAETDKAAGALRKVLRRSCPYCACTHLDWLLQVDRRLDPRMRNENVA